MKCIECLDYFRSMVDGDQVPKCNNENGKYYKQYQLNKKDDCVNGVLGFPEREKHEITKFIKGEQTVKVSGRFENVTEFHEKYPSSIITEIDGKPVSQVCESCECAISSGEECYSWNDMVFTCKKCGGENENHCLIKID